MRFCDMFGTMPTPERLAFEILSWGRDPGYSGTFRARWAKLQGLPAEVVAEVAAMEPETIASEGPARLRPYAKSLADLVGAQCAAGAEKTVLHNLLPTRPALTNNSLAAVVTQFPQDLIGFVRVDPAGGKTAADEIKRCVRSFGFRGVTVTPFWHRIRIDDEACRPVVETALEEGVALWVHTSVYWVRTTPLTYEHPLHLDAVAARYPDLRIIAGHGGWPWIPEMVAVCWRHPNLYVDTTAFRPKHLAVAGSGWEMLHYAMSRHLKGKVIFGSTWGLLGRPLADIAGEAASLDFDDAARTAYLSGAFKQALSLT